MTTKIINWFANLARNYVEKATQRKYENMINSKDFRSLYAKHGFKSEKEWVESARKILKENPERLAQILNYDVRKGSFGKYFR
jgi:hypothetical protein